MNNGERGKALVTGATGFVGRSLVPALRADGWQVVAGSRQAPRHAEADPGITWQTCDLLRPETLAPALAGVQVAYYLVHSMGGGSADFRQLERRGAEAFVHAAEQAGVKRVVYLGGPKPPGAPSEHLGSRLQVGEILRAGRVSAIELRASMVIGSGSASWQIVRDLAMRLPVMVLPRWLKSRSRPVALDDVLVALVRAAELPVDGSAWYDVPGPETLNGQQILQRIAGLRGRRILALEVPFLTPQLSALWLKLVTRTDFSLARELVQGLQGDLLPHDDRFWTLIDHTKLVSFDEAARRALAGESRVSGMREQVASLEEKLVAMTATRKPRG